MCDRIYVSFISHALLKARQEWLSVVKVSGLEGRVEPELSGRELSMHDDTIRFVTV